MKDPLTQERKKEFEKLLVEAWRKEYAKALKCGGFNENDYPNGSYLIAKIAACTFGENAFRPLSLQGKIDLDNFKKL